MEIKEFLNQNEEALTNNDMETLYGNAVESRISLKDLTNTLIDLEIDPLENMKVIRDSMFSGVKSITSVRIPETVTRIEHSAFEGSSLTDVYISKNVDWIDFKAFKDCGNLETITFDSENHIEGLSPTACEHCLKLKKVVLPDKAGFKINFLTFVECPGPIEINYKNRPLMSKTESLRYTDEDKSTVTGIPESLLNWKDALVLVQRYQF